MKLTKRILSLCLALAMLLTVATFPAFAEEGTYTPKTVEFVHYDTLPLKINTNYYASVSFTLPDVDYYVGDTITFSSTFLTDNTFTYDTKELSDIVVKVKKYGDSSANGEFYYSGLYNKSSYTFNSAGIYTIQGSGYTYADGSGTKWESKFQFATIEVKDPSTIKDVHTPTTEKTSGDAISLVSADIRSMKTGVQDKDYSDATIQTASILGSSSQNITGTANRIPGVILDFMFEFGSVSYVEDITFKAATNNLFYMADVYGSLNGTDWYLLNDDCVISPTGKTSGWTAETLTAEVNGVAKYVKLKNFKWKGSNYTTGVTNAAATGFALNEGDWTTGGEGGETPEPTTVDVTFVDVTGTNEDVVKTIDAGATVAAPDAYATGYKFYSDEACETEVDLSTATFNVATTIYVKAIPVTPDPEPDTPVIDTPKTVTVIRNPYFASGDVEVKPSTPSANAHKSFIPFVLSHKDIYVGDTIKIADDLFTANTFTFEGTKIVYAKMWVQKYSATEVKNGIDSQTGATYTFTEPGIYILRNEHYRLDNGSGGTTYKYYGDGRYNVFEVKDPNAVEAVAKPTTNKTSGATAATVTQAVIDTMNSSYTSDAVIALDFTSSEKHVSEYGNPGIANATATFAGLLLDYKFTLNSVSYVESVSWKASTDNGIYMVDVYGSIDGEDWYLLNEDCVVSPNGLNTTTTETTFTADVDGVAKYVKLANPRWKGQCLSKYTKTPSVVGFELAESEWGYGSTPAPEVPSITLPGVDPVEVTDQILATLPSVAQVAGKNYIVTGWTMNGAPVDYAALKNSKVKDITGDIVPTAVEVPFDVTILNVAAKTAGPDGDNTNFPTVDNSDTYYTNGLYIQGAQFRSVTSGKSAGLRFINVLNADVEAAIKAADGISNVDHGTLVVGNKDYSNKDLVVGSGVYNETGDMIYKTADEFNNEYYKYTVCVTGFTPEQTTLDIWVRPYISFDLGGVTYYLYGEQYCTNYKAVVDAAYSAGDITIDEYNTTLGLQ